MTTTKKKRRLVELAQEYDVKLKTDPMMSLNALRKVTGWSLAQIVAELVEGEAEAILEGLDEVKLLYDWEFWGRPSQIPPLKGWRQFAFIGGRGTGKTRAGAEWVHKMALAHPGCRIALVGRTSSDPRDVMIEGDSGITAIASPETRPVYYSSKRRLVWPNGSQATTFTSEEPSQLRGPQFHYAWADEAAAWKHTADDSGLSAWDNLVIATRLPVPDGSNQIFITTTPKRTPFMFKLLEDAADPKKRVLTSKGTTAENAGNLSKEYVDDMYNRYADSRLQAQELDGEMLDQVEGALWNDEHFKVEGFRVNNYPSLPLKVIAVDPSVAENPRDECGIVVVGATNHKKLVQRRAVVLDDLSLKAGPQKWIDVVIAAYDKYRCPVVVEKNQGGSLVATLLKAQRPEIPVLEVWAHQGKGIRAEPVAVKYDQGRVQHYGVHADLESQMTTWVPEETKGKSPDRIDALVYGITALLIKPPAKLGMRPMKAKSLAGRRLPGGGMGR